MDCVASWCCTRCVSSHPLFVLKLQVGSTICGVFFLEETHSRFSTTEATNKTLTADMQELRTRLAEAEEMARTAERQKNQLQRLLQEFRRRLTPLQQEMQRMAEKADSWGEKEEPAPSN